ncbi:MAG TPA: TetR/AcrR family transcriptional regulator [Stellaceae bacterium]|jgi:TetR/AcrR family transcriptional repressor of uid operon|nr:TetR/AcrR family transcriptional regulator [Stellaceae bacterium]
MRKLDPIKHEAKRRQILEVAERCFLRDGFRGASISDICAEARMSPGHLYHYFKSKEVIIRELVELHLQRVASRFAQMAEKPDVLEAFLDEIGIWRTTKLKRNPTLIHEVVAEASRNPAIAETLRRRIQALRDMLAGFLREGQERGQIDPQIDPDLAAAVLVSLVDAIDSLAAKDDEKFNSAEGIDLLKTLFARFLTPQAVGLPKRAGPAARQPRDTLETAT